MMLGPSKPTQTTQGELRQRQRAHKRESKATQSKGSQPAGPFCTAPDRPGHATPPGPSLAPLPITDHPYHLSLSLPLSLSLALARVSTHHSSFIHSQRVASAYQLIHHPPPISRCSYSAPQSLSVPLRLYHALRLYIPLHLYPPAVAYQRWDRV